MATYAARRLLTMVKNSSNVIAIELLAACQAVDLRTPYVTSGVLQETLLKIRLDVSKYEVDRFFAPDIWTVQKGVKRGDYFRFVGHILPSNSVRNSAKIG